MVCRFVARMEQLQLQPSDEQALGATRELAEWAHQTGQMSFSATHLLPKSFVVQIE